MHERNFNLVDPAFAATFYKVTCHRACLRPDCEPCRQEEYHRCPRKVFRWEDGFKNMVVNVGLNLGLTNLFKGGTAPAAWYVGLKAAGSPAYTDTMDSHAGWAESAVYSNATRPAITLATVTNPSPGTASLDNVGTTSAFNINAGGTVAGAFLATDNTKSGTVGSLYGAGDFTAPRVVSSGDTLNAQATLQMVGP